MENSDIPSVSVGPAEQPPPRARSAADWAGLVVLAGLVLFAGALVFVLGPLLAIACGSCPDGVRTPRFQELLLGIARLGVPITVLGTVIGLFLPRGGARVGALGLGVLVVLMVVVVGLGQVAA